MYRNAQTDSVPSVPKKRVGFHLVTAVFHMARPGLQYLQFGTWAVRWLLVAMERVSQDVQSTR